MKKLVIIGHIDLDKVKKPPPKKEVHKCCVCGQPTSYGYCFNPHCNADEDVF